LPADGTEPVIMLGVKHQVGFHVKTLQATSSPHLHHDHTYLSNLLLTLTLSANTYDQQS